MAVARRDARKALRRAARVKDGHVAFPASDNGLPLLRDTHHHNYQSMNRAAAGAGAAGGRRFTGRSGERLRLKALDEFRALRADVAEKRAGPANTDKAAGGGRGESGLRVMRRINSVSYTVADARREVYHG